MIFFYNESGDEIGSERVELPDEREKAVEKARGLLKVHINSNRSIRHGLVELYSWEYRRVLITSMTQGNIGNEDGTLN